MTYASTSTMTSTTGPVNAADAISRWLNDIDVSTCEAYAKVMRSLCCAHANNQSRHLVRNGAHSIQTTLIAMIMSRSKRQLIQRTM